MDDEGMEKYAVVEEDDQNKTAQRSTGAVRKCPKCGSELEEQSRVNVLKCPKCGTKPFEDAHNAE